jgi:hypothetical protein
MPIDPDEYDEYPPTCYRCDIEKPADDGWEDNNYNGEIFCNSCFNDRDRYGYPYMTDHDEMLANPSSYLPYGY